MKTCFHSQLTTDYSQFTIDNSQLVTLPLYKQHRMLSTQQIEFLNSTYSKDKLQSDWLPLVKKFVLANRDAEFDGVKLGELAKLIESKNSLNKQDLMLICFAVLLNES